MVLGSVSRTKAICVVCVFLQEWQVLNVDFKHTLSRYNRIEMDENLHAYTLLPRIRSVTSSTKMYLSCFFTFCEQFNLSPYS